MAHDPQDTMSDMDLMEEGTDDLNAAAHPKRQSRKPFLIVVVMILVLVGAAAAAWFLVFKPCSDVKAALEVTLASLESELRVKSAIAAQLPTLQTAVDEMRQEETDKWPIFSRKSAQETLTAPLTEALKAQGYQVAVFNLTQGTPEIKGVWEMQGVLLEMQGPSKKFAAAIAAVQTTLPNNFQIHEITTKKAAKPGTIAVTTQINSAFLLPAAEPAALPVLQPQTVSVPAPLKFETSAIKELRAKIVDTQQQLVDIDQKVMEVKKLEVFKTSHEATAKEIAGFNTRRTQTVADLDKQMQTIAPKIAKQPKQHIVLENPGPAPELEAPKTPEAKITETPLTETAPTEPAPAQAAPAEAPPTEPPPPPAPVDAP